jgi:hypothetical protein
MYTTTNGLRIDLTAAVTGASGISIVPSAAQAVRVCIIPQLQQGTYTNYGVVVNANSFAVISRSAAGVFSISQTAFVIPTGRKISWASSATLERCILGKDWTTNGYSGR